MKRSWNSAKRIGQCTHSTNLIYCLLYVTSMKFIWNPNRLLVFKWKRSQRQWHSCSFAIRELLSFGSMSSTYNAVRPLKAYIPKVPKIPRNTSLHQILSGISVCWMNGFFIILFSFCFMLNPFFVYQFQCCVRYLLLRLTLIRFAQELCAIYSVLINMAFIEIRSFPTMRLCNDSW